MAATEPDLPPPTAVPEFEHHYEMAHATKKGPWQKFVSFIWDSDYYEKSHAERKLIFKLDCFMLAALTFGWWLKNLDQTNLSNAYVSGMKEDLNINANQYTYMNTIYNAVVCAMQIPSNFIVMKVRPSYFLAACEIGWGIFTFAQAGAQSYQAMYGFRFCIALFESFYYPIAFFLLGSWYTRTELAKRIGLWFIAGPAGSAFSGYLQAGVYKGMDGTAGLAGWRWLYIVCGIITVPVGFLLIFLLPDFPENTKTWFLTEEDRDIARERVTRNGAVAMTGKINGRAIIACFYDWKFWVFVPLYCLYGFGVQNNQQFGVYLKAYKYSVYERNVYTAGMYLIEIPWLLFWSYVSDRVKFSRGFIMIIPLIWALVPTGILAFWGHSDKLRVFAFMVNGTIYMTPIFYAWLAELCGKETEKRAFITGSTSCLFYCFNAWLPTIVFLQTDGPRFKRGFLTTFACVIASIVLSILALFLAGRDSRRAKKDPQPAETPRLRPETDDLETKDRV